MKLATDAYIYFKIMFPGLKPEIAISSHGRIEILGNHTDHNGGLCLVGGVNMGVTAVISSNVDGTVSVASEGYPSFSFHVADLAKEEKEIGTTAALTKGVLFKLKQLGYHIGGFNVAIVSDIFPGAGVSSSACIEALLTKIIDVLYNDGNMDPLVMARVGQFAEREYFGKPCGLLDQVGACFGGVDFLDFKDMANPIVEHLDWNIPYQPVLVNTPSSHADLTDLYASIPADMKEVASKLYGVEILRQAEGKEPLPNNSCLSQLALDRAEHFFSENKRVLKAKEALLKGDAQTFLQCVKESGESSSNKLKNTMPPSKYENSPQEALDYAQKYIGSGAVRIMGGGFAGSIIAFLSDEDKKIYIPAMVARYDKENVIEVEMSPGGPEVVEW